MRRNWRSITRKPQCNAPLSGAISNGQLDSTGQLVNAKFNLTPFFNAAASAGQAQFFSLVNELFFHNTMSSELQSAMLRSMLPVIAPAEKAKAGLYIALTSSEYQVIH